MAVGKTSRPTQSLLECFLPGKEQKDGVGIPPPRPHWQGGHGLAADTVSSQNLFPIATFLGGDSPL